MSPIPMTDEECRVATEALSDQLDLYADLLVKKGAAVRPGQELVVECPVERADFARRVVGLATAPAPATSPSSGTTTPSAA